MNWGCTNEMMNFKGAGLGLSITKQFAEILGGSIGVESLVDKGSTFTVRVPMVYQENT
jgi:signal transduction histidine kinase